MKRESFWDFVCVFLCMITHLNLSNFKFPFSTNMEIHFVTDKSCITSDSSASNCILCFCVVVRGAAVLNTERPKNIKTSSHTLHYMMCSCASLHVCLPLVNTTKQNKLLRRNLTQANNWSEQTGTIYRTKATCNLLTNWGGFFFPKIYLR